ncbi:MAG: hypothetical protein CMN96_05030 [Synechococcus sp. MED850]|nr:hypothetical protein [Synechococcus sp. MED850]OUW98204.1 MAG: hypothetical protein CBD89_03750 [Cyanobacteria bacterium TMED229]
MPGLRFWRKGGPFGLDQLLQASIVRVKTPLQLPQLGLKQSQLLVGHVSVMDVHELLKTIKLLVDGMNPSVLFTQP